MGPILLAGDATEQVLLAYEHGSTAPDEFLHFRTAPDRSVELEAVKGNYWAGEEIGPDGGFSTLWFEMAAVRGDRAALQRAYRSFVLRHLALSPATRKPRIFYNTWNYQERLKHWKGKPYLSEMNTTACCRKSRSPTGWGSTSLSSTPAGTKRRATGSRARCGFRMG